jgi:hypothetical protein
VELITNIFYFFMGACLGVFFYAPSGSRARQWSKDAIIAVSIGMAAVVLFVVAVHYCDDACTAFLTSKIDEFARKMETINRVLRPSRADAP